MAETIRVLTTYVPGTGADEGVNVPALRAVEHLSPPGTLMFIEAEIPQPIPTPNATVVQVVTAGDAVFSDEYLQAVEALEDTTIISGPGV